MLRGGKIAKLLTTDSNPQTELVVVDQDKLQSMGYSIEEISNIVTRESAGGRDWSFSVPAEARGLVKSDRKYEGNGDFYLQHIENAIYEIEAIMATGHRLDAMRPALREAFSKLHKSHAEYREQIQKYARSGDEGFVSIDPAEKSLSVTGRQIGELLAGFIKRDFEWCETTNPFQSGATGHLPGSDDQVRSYVTRGNNEGWLVTAEAFSPSAPTPPRQFFRAKTASAKSAHKMSEVISLLLSDRVAKHDIDLLNTFGGSKPEAAHGMLGVIAAKATPETTLRDAVNLLDPKNSITNPKQS